MAEETVTAFSGVSNRGKRITNHDAHFWEYVDIRSDTECWEWRAGKLGKGYGRYEHPRVSSAYAHRVSYTLSKGEIPPGLQVDHLCRNRLCVNPNHLEAVTPRVNVLRGHGVSAMRARKTHCPSGHEYTPENTWVSSQNERTCRTCNRERARKRRATKKIKA